MILKDYQEKAVKKLVEESSDLLIHKYVRFGLFDIKTGMTLSDSQEKSEGLQAYIKDQNKKGKKLFGGIVTNTDQRNLTGRWIYFDGKSNLLSDRDWSKWKYLIF